MQLPKYTLEMCLKNAKKYLNKKEWRKNDRYFYHNAWKRGWMQDCSKHMNNPFAAPTDEECLKTARCCVHISDWVKKYSREYSKAKKDKNLYQECVKHMTPLGNINKRCLYIFYGGNECYIGITYNINHRMKQHILTERYKNLEAKYGKVKVELLSDFLSIDDVKILEINTIEKYKKNGWKILNKSKGGEIGGRNSVYNDKDLFEQAKLFTSPSEWKKCDNSLYSIAHYRGLYFNCTKHMLVKSKRTKDTLIKIASNYSTKREWRKFDKLSYDSAYNMRVLDECCVHMKPENSWLSFITVKSEALKYRTTKEWKEISPGSYYSAFKNGWYKELSKSIKQKRNEVI